MFEHVLLLVVTASSNGVLPGQGVDEILEVAHRNRIVALGIEAPRARIESEPPLQVLLHSSLHRARSRHKLVSCVSHDLVRYSCVT